MSARSRLPQTRVDSVDRLVRDACARGGDRPFLVSAEEDATVQTFREFDAAVSRAANVLRGLGIAHREGGGDVVSLFLRNSPGFFPAWLGAVRAGGVANPINLGLERNVERVVYMLKKSRAKLFVMETAFADLARAVAAECPELPILFVDGAGPDSVKGIKSPVDWRAALAAAAVTAPEIPVQPGDPFQMIFTSGTTGLPKAVVQRHEMVMDAFSLAEHFDLGAKDVCVCVLPFFHVNAQYASFFPMLNAGGSLVLFEKYSASRFWPVVEKHRATYISVVPSLLTRMLAAGLPDKKAFASVRFIICGAAPLTTQLHQEFVEKTGIPVPNGWGMTETGCWGCQMDPKKLVWGGMGTPLPINEMRIADPATGAELPAGETGLLLIRGPNVFREYFDAADATAKAFRFGDGWFDTGDDARVDATGQYWFVGRGSVDTGKVDGEFVNYLTIDEKLWNHPAVREVCCVGVPDAIRGNVVAACIVRNDGAAAAATTADDITAYARKQGLASFEMPRHVFFVEEIPKGDTGKIQRRVMAERAAELLAKK
jgi:acyl-coenzyme A synthetase/AMP-(fatty) acid ligase